MIGNWALGIPDGFLEALAQRLAELLNQMLGASSPEPTVGWLDVDGAAAYLSMSPAAIRSAIKRGQLPGKRANGRVLFTRAELDNYVTKGQA